MGSSVASLRILTTLAVSMFFFSACTQELGFQNKLPDSADDDSVDAEDDSDPTNPGSGGPGGNNPPSACAATALKTESFALEPDAIAGANIVFLIDDSGSMTGEFQKVVWELQTFINGILAVTDNNYRMIMIYNTAGAAINGRAFYRDQGLTDRIMDPNPFIDQIMSDDVDYFQKETWSKWADMAFARVFMPEDFMQTLPSVIPADNPNDASITVNSAAITPAQCQGAGKYFRPREFTSDYSYGSFPCISAQDKVDIRTQLLEDFNVNIVAISDDDLNVNFDRANFSPTDATKNAYPEIVDQMFQDIVAPLGEDVRYVYHSIVGPIGSDPGADVDKDGVSHLALSKHTGGATYDIRSANWQPLFEQLTQQIIYSSQDSVLGCRPNPTGLVVKFNDTTVDPADYSVSSSRKKISFKEGAFEGYPPGEEIAVQVIYHPAAGQ